MGTRLFSFLQMQFGLSLAVLAVTLGCRTDASLYVWKPPQIESAVGQGILVAPLLGEPQLAEDVLAAVHASKPVDDGRHLSLYSPQQLQAAAHGPVMLASAVEQASAEPMSDLTLLALARQAGVDWMLMGEILSEARRSQQPPSLPTDSQASTPPDSADRLAVVWRLYDVSVAKPVADRAVVVDKALLAQRYPELASSPVALTTAAGREAWRLVTPAIETTDVELARPWARPGSRLVREANALAIAGDWPAAASRWADVLDSHPRQHAAVHNLAIASAAAQDFSTARRQIHEALQMRDCQHYRQTAAWIETQQRAYHRAFALPDPPEGWTLTRD